MRIRIRLVILMRIRIRLPKLKQIPCGSECGTLIKMQLSPSASIGTSRDIPTTTIITITTASTRTQHTTQIIVITTRRRRRKKWTRRRDGDSSGDRFWPTAAIPLRKQFHQILLLFSIRIPDPGSKKTPSPVQQREFTYRMYFEQKNFLLISRRYDPGCSSRSRILIFFRSRTRILWIKSTRSWIRIRNNGFFLNARRTFKLFTRVSDPH